jgi:hypothetical protein
VLATAVHAMRPLTNVVDQQDVGHTSQTRDTASKAAQYTIAAVVEARREGQWVRIALVGDVSWINGLQASAHLGRDENRLRPSGQKLTKPFLSAPEPVEGCGIEIADPGVPGRRQQTLGDTVGHRAVEIADPCCAEP